MLLDCRHARPAVPAHSGPHWVMTDESNASGREPSGALATAAAPPANRYLRTYFTQRNGSGTDS